MKVCLVSGVERNIKKVKTSLENIRNANITVSPSYRKINDLTEELFTRGITIIQDVDAILILDFGFTNRDSKERLDELISLQDVLDVKGFKKKLYLVMKDSELYSILKKVDDENTNFVYKNTKVFLYDGKLSPNLLSNVVIGKMDDKGVSHREFGKVKDIYDIDESRDLYEGIEDFGGMYENEKYSNFTGENVSEIDSGEYLGSASMKKHVTQKDREERMRQRKLEREKKRLEREAGKEEQSLIAPEHVYVNESDISESRIKIVNDKGVLVVTGVEGSGISGVVSNIAQMYDKVDSKVAVLDLDIYKNYQSIYFKRYNEVGTENNGLVNLVENYKSNIVTGTNVEGNIDVFSIRRDEVVNKEFESKLITRLSVILRLLKSNYDVVVVDMPLNYLSLLTTEDEEEINAVLFLTENLTFKLEDLFILNLRKLVAVNELVVTRLLDRSYIAYNKYVEGRYGFSEDEKCDEFLLRDLIDNLPRPYSKVIYTTFIPFDVKWEHQIMEDVRWIDSGNSAENEKTITHLLGKVIFK